MTEKVTKTIRQAVFDDNEVRETTQRLILLSNQLFLCKEERGKAETNLKYDTGVADARAALTAFENEVAYEVKHDVWVVNDGDLPDPKNVGKPKFTNDAQRKAEVARRLMESSDPDWDMAQTDINDALRYEQKLTMKVIEAKAALVSREAQFQANLAIAAMIAGLAHESTTNTTHRHTMTMKIGENHVQN